MIKKKYKEQLLNSIMFNLSLSSKELFHSNFLAYLINNDNGILSYLFDEIIGINWNGEVTAKREKDNFDLLIYDKNNCLVIENKVKSIPDIKQLIKYKKKAENKYKKFDKKYILLTIYEPYELKEVSADWIVVNYLDILKGLKRYCSVIDNTYLKESILDYIVFMDTLVNLFKELEMKQEESIYINEGVLKELKKLRIHDLFYKSRFEMLKSDLVRCIRSEYSDNYVVMENNKWQELSVNHILVDNNFTRGTGLFELKVPIDTLNKDEKNIIGVQLQDHTFKLLLQSTNRDKISSIAEKLSRSNAWFDFSILNNTCVTISKQKQEYCQYNSKEGLMLYKYKVIEDVSRITIIELFMKYLKYAENNKEIINKAFL